MKRGKFEAQKPSRKPTAAQKHTGGASAPKQSDGGKKVGIILGCVILLAREGGKAPAAKEEAHGKA